MRVCEANTYSVLQIFVQLGSLLDGSDGWSVGGASSSVKQTLAVIDALSKGLDNHESRRRYAKPEDPEEFFKTVIAPRQTIAQLSDLQVAAAWLVLPYGSLYDDYDSWLCLRDALMIFTFAVSAPYPKERPGKIFKHASKVHYDNSYVDEWGFEMEDPSFDEKYESCSFVRKIDGHPVWQPGEQNCIFHHKSMFDSKLSFQRVSSTNTNCLSRTRGFGLKVRRRMKE